MSSGSALPWQPLCKKEDTPASSSSPTWSRGPLPAVGAEGGFWDAPVQESQRAFRAAISAPSSTFFQLCFLGFSIRVYVLD